MENTTNEQQEHQLHRERNALKYAINALNSIKQVHAMHCEHHKNVSKHSYDLAFRAETSIRALTAMLGNLDSFIED